MNAYIPDGLLDLRQTDLTKAAILFFFLTFFHNIICLPQCFRMIKKKRKKKKQQQQKQNKNKEKIKKKNGE